MTVIALELGCGAGSGGSGAGGSGGSGGATGTTSTITLDSKTICEQYCVAAIEAGCTDSSVSACAESCLHAYEIFPECADAFDHLYACYAEEVPVGGCNGQCPAQNQAVGDCL